MKKSKSFISRIKAVKDNHHISIFWFFLPKIILLGTYESWYPVGIFDLVFIDGDKENYLVYLKLALKNNTISGSVIVVDNIFFHGDVFNDKATHAKGIGAKKVLEYVRKNQKLFSSISIIPLYDGTLILKKK